jgi:ABC-2 type transport system permease protein
MTAALAIARVTTRQLLGLKRLVGFGVMTLAPAALFFVGSRSVDAFTLLDRFLGIVLGSFFWLIVPIITLIIAASALGDERRDSTLSFLVLRPISRVSIGASKLVTGILTAFILTGLGALALGTVYGIRSDDWAYVIPTVVGTAVATTVYAALFVPLGYLSERSTLIGLAYVFIWELGVVSAVTGLSATSPSRVGLSAFYALIPEDGVAVLIDFGVTGVDGGLGNALWTTAVFLILSLGFIIAVLRRRDLV